MLFVTRKFWVAMGLRRPGDYAASIQMEHEVQRNYFYFDVKFSTPVHAICWLLLNKQ